MRPFLIVLLFAACSSADRPARPSTWACGKRPMPAIEYRECKPKRQAERLCEIVGGCFDRDVAYCTRMLAGGKHRLTCMPSAEECQGFRPGETPCLETRPDEYFRP